MPVGYTSCWVSRKHDDHPEVPLGWGFVPTVVSLDLIADGCAVLAKGGTPQRYLPMPNHDPFVPIP